MGERLNLEITNNGKVLANSYYHWSGYLDVAIELTSKALQRYNQLNLTETDPLKVALQMLYATGAGIPEDQINFVPANTAVRRAYDRNTGLIGISEQSIAATQYWANETVVIDIGTNTIDISRLMLPLECYDDDETDQPLDVVEFDFQISNIAFDCWNEQSSQILKHKDQCMKFVDSEICYGA